MEFIKAKKRIATLWFIYSGVIIIIMILQTIGGKFEDKASEAWGWFLPSIIPTLSLILGVFLLDIRNNVFKLKEVDKFYFRLAFILSAFYLSVLFLILISKPFLKNGIIDLMQQSTLFIAPIQGLVNASMGLFFIKQN